jgi:hypothetical protein
MKTPLNLASDIMLTAKTLGSSRGKSAGKVLSGLARAVFALKRPQKYRNGFRLLPKGKDNIPVTVELINRLRDELP